MFTPQESAALDRELTASPDDWQGDEAEDREITDYFDERIDDSDGVFELTVETWSCDPDLATSNLHHDSYIATQQNIVDAIEEFGADNVIRIEFVAFGKQYKEMERVK